MRNWKQFEFWLGIRMLTESRSETESLLLPESESIIGWFFRLPIFLISYFYFARVRDSMRYAQLLVVNAAPSSPKNRLSTALWFSVDCVFLAVSNLLRYKHRTLYSLSKFERTIQLSSQMRIDFRNVGFSTTFAVLCCLSLCLLLQAHAHIRRARTDGRTDDRCVYPTKMSARTIRRPNWNKNPSIAKCGGRRWVELSQCSISVLACRLAS